MRDRDRGMAVQDLLDRAVAAGLSLGLVGLAVLRDGGGRAWCAGRLRVGGPPADPHALYDLASLTKPLATGTLLVLAMRDGLELRAPLGEFLPELHGSPWAEVSLEACATHTAGFPAWAPLYGGGGGHRDAYLETLADISPVAPPGSRVEYSCLGFIALGLVLERGFGASLGAVFAELVASPLGLDNELLFVPGAATVTAAGQRRWGVEEAKLAELALPVSPPSARPGTVPCDDGNARGLGGEAGNAGLFGTAAAVASLAAEYLPGGGVLLTGEEADLATRCRTDSMAHRRSLGWQLAGTPGCSAGPSLSSGAVGHTGFTGTSLWLDGLAGAVLVLLSNRLHPGGRTPDLHPLRRRFHTLALATLGCSGRRDPVDQP